MHICLIKSQDCSGSLSPMLGDDLVPKVDVGGNMHMEKTELRVGPETTSPFRCLPQGGPPEWYPGLDWLTTRKSLGVRCPGHLLQALMSKLFSP